jgi:G:T-mismatch repair DNA endonuclease (very short patch repair protein)
MMDKELGKFLHVQMDDDCGGHGFWIYSNSPKRAIERYLEQVEKLVERDIRGRVLLSRLGVNIETFWHRKED